jgi:mevalonate pyrophosphate decarboxylase
MCPCGSRKDKVYETNAMFSAHVKSKTHQNWLQNLNLNKANLYIENKDLNDLVKNQRLIIAKAEAEINNLRQTITYLTMQLQKPAPSTNLLEFD